MLIWNLIDVSVFTECFFSFDKGSNGPNHKSLLVRFQPPNKKNVPQKNLPFPPLRGFPIPKRYLENLFILTLLQEKNVFQYNINQRRKPKIHHHRDIFDSPIKTTVESYS